VASAWGASWGSAFGNAWGSIATGGIGPGIGRGGSSRKVKQLVEIDGKFIEVFSTEEADIILANERRENNRLEAIERRRLAREAREKKALVKRINFDILERSKK
jgi:hypothetical protein